jgi:transcriptional regulator with XRE-family HTH domain
MKECSLRDVEEATGISNAYVSQLERGQATGPSPHKLYKLAEFYDTSYEALMRAAGYIREEGEGEEEKPGPFEMQLMSLDLSEDEKDMIVDFVKSFLRKDED